MFLLSLGEAERYFPSDEERLCKPTQYALSQDNDIVDKDTGDGCWRWLRSPSYDACSTSGVWPDGSLCVRGLRVGLSYAVRPALWLNLSA